MSPTPTTATTAPPGGLPLTSGQAERLAVARFRNYSAGTMPVSISIPGATPALVDALVDFRKHVGFGSLTVSPAGGRAETIRIAWSFDKVAYATPLVTDTSQWQTRPMGDQPILDTPLLIVLNLAADRPDNAQLLQQSSARWLGSGTEGGVAVDVLTGPAPAAPSQTSTPATTTAAATTSARTRYYVDASGQLLRFDIASGSGQSTVLRFPALPASNSATAGPSGPAIPEAIERLVAPAG